MGNIIFDLSEVWTSETENKQHREFSNMLPTKQTSMALSFLFSFLTLAQMICVVDGVYWAKSDLFQPEIETTTNMKSSATI
jgi:hypothetical protein